MIEYEAHESEGKSRRSDAAEREIVGWNSKDVEE